MKSGFRIWQSHRPAQFAHRASLFVLALGALCAGPVAAQTAEASGLAVVSAKSDPLPVFATAGASAASGSVAVTGLPWPVKESRADFFLVSIDGRDVWIDSMMVRATRKVAARCAAIAGAVVAGELGAASNRCR